MLMELSAIFFFIIIFCFVHVQIYLNRVPNDRNRLLIPCCLNSPNPKCYVCAPKPEVTVVLNTTTFKVGALQDKVSCSQNCYVHGVHLLADRRVLELSS